MFSTDNLPVEREVEVKASRIHGRGVFARRAFRAGDVVLRWDVSYTLSREDVALLSDQERKYTHPFDAEQSILVQAPERYVNHSCDNNTVVRDFSDIALRDIAAGEEITSDYSLDGSGSNFNCSCGAENCRGQVQICNIAS
jgi:uncharacterized protein